MSASSRSRVIPKIDDRPVWSIVCFFVDKRARGRGGGELFELHAAREPVCLAYVEPACA